MKWFIIVAVLILIAVLAAVAYFMILTRKKKPGSTEVYGYEGGSGNTEILDVEDTSGLSGVIDMDSIVYRVKMTDIEKPENNFEVVVRNDVIIGRNSSMCNMVVNYDKSVSQQHCKLFARKSQLWVVDLNSANHTYVDDKRIYVETTIYSGCTLRLGRISLLVTIVPIH